MTWPRYTKRQARRLLKAEVLDSLSQQLAAYDPEPSRGLTAEEVAGVYEEISRELYSRAVRLTFPGEAHN